MTNEGYSPWIAVVQGVGTPQLAAMAPVCCTYNRHGNPWEP